MTTWGWKHSAMFLIALACATGSLVAAELADTTAARAASTATHIAR